MKKHSQVVLFIISLLPAVLYASELPTVHYQVTETKVVESDLLAVMVNIQYKAQDAGAVAAQVNKTALQIIEMSQTLDDVQVTSGGYQTWSQPYGKKSMGRVEWVVSQTLTLETHNFHPLLEKLGEIQKVGGQVHSLNYTVSPRRQQEIEDQLKVNAISRFRERASEYAVAAGVEAEQWKLLTLTVGEEADKPPVLPMARGMFAMDSAQGVNAPADKEVLSATVSGTIVLLEKRGEIEEKIQTFTGKVVDKLKDTVEEGLEYGMDRQQGVEQPD